MERLTILGGGPAGLSVAFYAHRAGIQFDLYEKTARLGGLCQTLHYQKHSYDTGAHRFHNRDPEITNDLKGLLGDALFEVSRPSKVFMGGRFIDFPPTPIGMFRSAGLRQRSWRTRGGLGPEARVQNLLDGRPKLSHTPQATSQSTQLGQHGQPG